MSLKDIQGIVHGNPNIRYSVFTNTLYVSPKKMGDDMLNIEMNAILIDNNIFISDSGETWSRLHRMGIENPSLIIDIIMLQFPEIIVNKNCLMLKIDGDFMDKFDMMTKIIDTSITSGIKISKKDGTCRILGASKE